MSVQLNLLPIKNDTFYSHEVIAVEDNDVYDNVIRRRINTLKQVIVDDSFKSYLSRGNDDCEETHYGITLESPYGERLMYVLAKDLKTVELTGTAGAYVKVMNDEDKVVLYWH